MEKDFSKFGFPPQPKIVKMSFTENELDLLRMSVKGLYAHFRVRSELFFDSSMADEVYNPIISRLNELYWKIYKVS